MSCTLFSSQHAPVTGKIDIQRLGPKGAVPPHGEQLGIWAVMYTACFHAMKHELCISSLGHTCCRRSMVRSYLLRESWHFALPWHNPCMESCSRDVNAHHNCLDAGRFHAQAHLQAMLVMPGSPGKFHARVTYKFLQNYKVGAEVWLLGCAMYQGVRIGSNIASRC